jgi:hypothetical protein
VPPTAWFVAAIAAGGLWYFPTESNWFGLGLVAAVTAALLFIAAFLQAMHGRSSALIPARRDAKYLLRLVWNYPLRGHQQRSWAVKESAVLLGEMDKAQEHPGIAVAMVTTELALLVFGCAVDNRIDSFVAWALERCEARPPFRLIEPDRDPIGYTTKNLLDLRHTLALAVVLMRAGREHDRTAEHIRLALQTQQKDGSWYPAKATKADNALFTTLYGTELLCLAARNPLVSREALCEIARARTKAFEWLIRNRDKEGVWSTGLFQDHSWDTAVGTAWVLHRPLSPPRKLADQWRRCREVAIARTIQLVERRETWLGISDALRFRIEARVAAAIGRTTSCRNWSVTAAEQTARYMGAWAIRSRTTLRRLDEADIDLGTAAFVLWSLWDIDDLVPLGRSILADGDS